MFGLGKFLSELQDLFGDLRGPAKALIVVLIGMAFAWMLINQQWAAALLLVLLAIVAGYLLELIGTLLLPQRPRAGLLFLEGWVLGPAAIAAFVSGLLVVLAIDLTPPKDTDAATEELMKTLAAGLSTFLSAAFVSWISEQDNTRISDRIRGQFYKKYKRAKVFPSPADGACISRRDRRAKPQSIRVSRSAAGTSPTAGSVQAGSVPKSPPAAAFHQARLK